ncbi:MAG: hypothetical protein WC831_01490 [Parcubacteria group bacterium]|jgi:hypothetical protein
MDKEKFPVQADNTPLVAREELEYFQNKEKFIKPEVADLVSGIREENVYEVAGKIIEDADARIILKLEVVRRILNCEPVSFSDVRACNENNPDLSTISDMAGNALGVFRLQDIVYKDGMVFLKTLNTNNQAIHYASIPKNILIDILRTALKDEPSAVSMKVPVSVRQKEILDQVMARMNMEKAEQNEKKS